MRERPAERKKNVGPIAKWVWVDVPLTPPSIHGFGGCARNGGEGLAAAPLEQQQHGLQEGVQKRGSGRFAANASGGVVRYLGLFDTAVEAAVAYAGMRVRSAGRHTATTPFD